MWRHYVYIHYRASNGEPFYVGKGTHRKREKKQSFDRAKAPDSRSKWWHRIVNKHGLQIEIIASCKTDDAAQELEKSLISKIGRKDLGRGPLINITDGGDGHAGILMSEATRKKHSENAKKPRSLAWRQSISKTLKNNTHLHAVKRGDKLPIEWKNNLAKAKRGAGNPWFGKPTPVAKKIKNVNTGVIYDSIARAAKAEGFTAGALYQCLDGTCYNKTPLVKI